MLCRGGLQWLVDCASFGCYSDLTYWGLSTCSAVSSWIEVANRASQQPEVVEETERP
jgi:hypothetical protein